ncbi:cell envelope-related function transcriptional attenuator common domain protein [Desulfosporosinus orientis DSM 765]|uniref:Cell envelope-related function transcriptional attenuator common domain protein n=1 Tax=Desulfosporosinus orientis (strain ATCC 19365 / DSM 765 / NCIMB 8382 / VKM B-1628 / Singapore I) TaxID=768706 RepID=G7WAI8_DESOD|nr:LCP family protein [Desulfosporosinus orientis]AET66756.1 cell envelope-related function transcriptional attenuator common domain protein [Desulfosporosinus orientis DSM 765]
MTEKKKQMITLFRVIGAYKKSMLLGFLIGVSLVLGSFLINQVISNERIPITLAKGGTETRPILNPDHIENNQNSQEKKSIQIPETVKEKDDIEVEESNHTYSAMQKRFTVLIVGVDQRPGEKSYSNTDTLLVASINTENGKVNLLSIPRDTQVNIPGRGKEKINAAARLGKGLKTTQAIIEQLIAQPIDGYVLTNFDGFKTIIDTLGGITLTVEKNMYYVTGDAKDGVINLKKGTQRLNGAQALQYARFRQDALADISRTSRQQAVLKAMEREFLQVKTLSKLPALISQMTKAVETNLSFSQLWAIGNVLLRVNNPEVVSQTLPGNFLIENDISYWKVDPKKSKAIVKRFIEEGKTSSVFFQ